MVYSSMMSPTSRHLPAKSGAVVWLPRTGALRWWVGGVAWRGVMLMGWGGGGGMVCCRYPTMAFHNPTPTRTHVQKRVLNANELIARLVATKILPRDDEDEATFEGYGWGEHEAEAFGFMQGCGVLEADNTGSSWVVRKKVKKVL